MTTKTNTDPIIKDLCEEIAKWIAVQENIRVSDLVERFYVRLRKNTQNYIKNLTDPERTAEDAIREAEEFHEAITTHPHALKDDIRKYYKEAIQKPILEVFKEYNSMYDSAWEESIGYNPQKPNPSHFAALKNKVRDNLEELIEELGEDRVKVEQKSISFKVGPVICDIHGGLSKTELDIAIEVDCYHSRRIVFVRPIGQPDKENKPDLPEKYYPMIQLGVLHVPPQFKEKADSLMRTGDLKLWFHMVKDYLEIPEDKDVPQSALVPL